MAVALSPGTGQARFIFSPATSAKGRDEATYKTTVQSWHRRGQARPGLGAGDAVVRLHGDGHITAGVLHQAGATRRSVSWVRLFGEVVRPLPPKGILVVPHAVSTCLAVKHA